jgi:hypothetical protein
MRIVSQDKTVDIDYRNVILQSFKFESIDKNKPLEWVIIDKSSGLDLGTYSSEEKVLKVMEMIRYASMGYIDKLNGNYNTTQITFDDTFPIITYFYMPQDNE